MNEALPLALSVLAGLGIGIFFYGGLWLTVSRISSARRPGLLLVASSAARAALALVAMAVVSQGSAGRIMLCLLGFLIARPLVFRFTRSFPPPRPRG
jgi:F1F0 ATPase subunit 2